MTDPTSVALAHQERLATVASVISSSPLLLILQAAYQRPMVEPPSTTKFWPVVNEPAREPR